MSTGNITLASIARGGTDLKVSSHADGDSSKAVQYAHQLYEARCNGHWASIGELARKVEKHAPKRRCMALAARSGARMYQHPSSENFTLADKEFGQHLDQAIQRSDAPAIDILDGTVTRAAMLLGVQRVQSAIALIPEPLHRIAIPASGDGVEAWVAICVLQGMLVRGVCLERLDRITEAGNTYRSIIGYLSHVVKLSSQCSELRRWIEETLSKICLFFSAPPGQPGEAMASFHLLSQFLDGQSWRPLECRGTFSRQSSRQVWRAYYETLSKVIQDDLVYHPSPLHRDHDTIEHRGLLDDDEFTATRTKQRADLRRVESNYEDLLLQQTQFPKANETNEEVKGWVELAMGNWRILCGPTWTTQEIGAGPGGKAVVARNTLDILYRAATKTFHSTQILRHLFTVHAYLGEFDLAYKAFDTYVDIMTKGKARVEKSGQAGLELDDDETAVRLGSEAIRIACRLGSEANAEKALNIGEALRTWIGEGKPTPKLDRPGEHAVDVEEASEHYYSPRLSAAVISLAHRSIGISQANFACSTPLPTSRVEMRKKAIESLRLSLQQGLDPVLCGESYYALSLVLAENRDVTEAIKLAKETLQHPEGLSDLSKLDGGASKMNRDSAPSNDTEISRHVKLLPVWHLLSQLLCAREEFDMASTCCDLSLERLGGLSNLLGKRSSNGPNVAQRAFAKDFPQAARENPRYQNPVEAMDNLQKQVVLEIKMTRLCLAEIIDGPEAAVNGANELLALFARLFGTADLDVLGKSKANAMMSPPKSSSGTIRSIFGRPKSMKRTAPNSQAASALPSKTNSAITTRPTTSTTVKPAIQVTNPTGGVTPQSQNADQEQKPKHNVLKKKSSSIKRQPSSHGRAPTAQVDEKEIPNGHDPPQSSHARVSFQNEKAAEQANESNATQPTDFANTSSDNKLAPPQEQAQPQPPAKTQPTPSHELSGPRAPVFVEIQEQKFKASLLIKIWLFVARLYSKISLFDDAKEAIQEAHKLATSLQMELCKHNASMRVFQDQGWGGGKSLEELWADVFSEDGKLYEYQSLPHDALRCFENALSYNPDHPEAAVSLSNILLDIYGQKIPSEKPDPSNPFSHQNLAPTSLDTSTSTPPGGDDTPKMAPSSSQLEPEPAELSRLACRDRAYGLLSSLTKLGAGWDDPEAWFVLARAQEESGQIDKAKEALWWTVHLEDTKPVRHWRNVNPGGYVL